MQTPRVVKLHGVTKTLPRKIFFVVYDLCKCESYVWPYRERGLRSKILLSLSCYVLQVVDVAAAFCDEL